MHTPNAGICILINYDEDPYRQRFSAAHEACHALLDAREQVTASIKGQNTQAEVRANYFASYFLMPQEILGAIGSDWTDDQVVKWANELQVSTQALAIALVRDRIITPQRQALLKDVRVPKHMKRDPELPRDLSGSMLSRKKQLMERGLSSQYVNLCFDAYDEGVASASRVAEMLLTDIGELSDLAALFGRNLKHGD
jgi:Zn-dependent peptidase ImmA (M78 family)